jgi:hypothetical protein
LVNSITFRYLDHRVGRVQPGNQLIDDLHGLRRGGDQQRVGPPIDADLEVAPPAAVGAAPRGGGDIRLDHPLQRRGQLVGLGVLEGEELENDLGRTCGVGHPLYEFVDRLELLASGRHHELIGVDLRLEARLWLGRAGPSPAPLAGKQPA